MSDIGPEAPPDYLSDLAKLSAQIDEGQKLVEQGYSIDLTNFEKMVAVICARMADTPPDNPDDVRLAIEDLVAKLTNLSAVIKAQAGNQE